MANLIIEDALKTLLDADVWAVSPDGVTKNTFIKIESAKRSSNVDLRNPGRANNTTNNIFLVIYQSIRTPTDRSTGGDSFSYIGDLGIYGNTPGNMKSAFTKLKALQDDTLHLDFNIGGISGNENSNKFWTVGIYHWDRYVSH